MATLEYYAFEAKQANSDHAAKNYRLLARKGFNDFVYAQVGYNPGGSYDIAWQLFHDRVSLSHHTVPDGYFSLQIGRRQDRPRGRQGSAQIKLLGRIPARPLSPSAFRADGKSSRKI
jgi:hypothetical protein